MDLPPEPTIFEREVVDKTLGEIRTFLDQIANGSRQYLTIHNLTEQIEHQYHGRFVIELLQNAHDALQATPRAGSRRIEFVLDSSAGPHGVLYAANDGRSFRREDLRALANLGQSSKDPRESIGNKGIGFRSVLEVCRAPEIYSCAGEARERFDGYCFRFSSEVLAAAAAPLARLLEGADALAWPLGDATFTLDDLRSRGVRARCREEGIDLVREFRHLSPYLLPLPARSADDRLHDFARRGFATVVRLPLASEDARETAAARLRELDADTLVFLDGLRSLLVRVDDEARLIERQSHRRAGKSAYSVIIRHGAEVTAYWRWDYVLKDVAALRAASAALPGRWKELAEAPLGVAVRVHGQPGQGRFFIHLPTEVTTGTGALLHAPFFGEMSRKAIDFNLPLNRLLRGTLANCVVDVVRKHLMGHGKVEARAIVDLLAPVAGTAPDWLAGPLGLLRGDALLLTDNQEWRAAGAARLVPTLEGARVFSPEQLRTCARFDCVHRALDGRRELVESLLRALGARTAPTDAECAATVAAAASQHRGSWEDFWREVERLLPGKADALLGHRVLVDEQGALHPAGGAAGVQVFFPRAHNDSGDDPTPIAIPRSLQDRIAFLSSEIPLRRRRPDGPEENTSTRRYLDPLVKVYRVDTILQGVLAPAVPSRAVALTGPDAELCADVLDLAVRLLRGAREVTTLVPELRRLRLPCRGGWFPPGECLFGPGWQDTCGELLEVYLRAAETREATDALRRLLLEPEHQAWRGHGGWLRPHLAGMGVRDGLFPRPVPSAWRHTFFMASGASVTLPEAPPGVAANHWASYAAAVGPSIKPEYRGRFAHTLENVQGLDGLDALDSLPPAGRRALTLLLFRSLRRWPDGWQGSQVRKTGGQWYAQPIASFLHHSLRVLPWIWCDEDGKGHGVAPPERWFVRASTESVQRRQFDHLRPLPPDLTRELARLDGAAVPALVGLGLPVLDLDARSGDPRLLVDLAEALAEDRVGPAARNIFPGQVRDAWRAFHPTDQTPVPEVIIVQRAGRSLEAYRPSEIAPVYLPDVATRGGDFGPFGALPVALMEPRDASRLLPHFQAQAPGRFRALSALRTEVIVGGARWVRADPPVRLMGSALHWLATLALAVSAFAGSQAHGAQTKEFRQRLAAVRATSIEGVADLALRVAGLGDNREAHRSASVWDAGTQTILYDANVPGWLETLAGPLAQMLDRVDVVTPLRYVLSKLPPDQEPEITDLDRAVAAIDISPVQLAEVRQLYAGDHAWVCERLRPAFELLAPDAAWDAIATAETEEALVSELAAVLPDGIAPAALIALARESRDDRAMGSGLFEVIGERAQLSAWNAALGRIGPPYRALTSASAEEQFRSHRQAAQLPLRAVARYVCRSGTGLAFGTLAEALRTCPAPPDLATRFWTVPFATALAALAAVFDGAKLPDAVRDALTARDSVEEVAAALAAADPTIEPTCDPAEVHRANVAVCQQVFDALRRAALAWCGREAVAPGRWLDAAATQLAPLRARMDGGDGFLRRWDEAEALAAVTAVLGREPAHAAFWDAVAASANVDDLRGRLSLRDDDLAGIDEVITAAHERQRRAARTILVCGAPFDSEAENLDKLWDHLAARVADDRLPAIDPARLPSLAGQPPASGRSGSRANGGGSGRRAPRLPDSQKRVIGLAGEIFAYRMLRRRFGETAVSPSAWVSENSRHCFPQNSADDGLGFDFRIVVGRKTWCIEVKATTGQESAFDLGPTEVRAAVECAGGKQRIFRVLHVLEALSDTPRAVFLPNPFDAEGQSRFRLDEAGLFVRYQVAD